MLAHREGPGPDGETVHEPGMNHVEVLFEPFPCFIRIHRLELQIGWYKGRLNWREVNTNHISARYLISNIHSLDASTSADVEYSGWIDRC
jgi:hypothetical protein